LRQLSHVWFIVRWLHVLAMAFHLDLWGDPTFHIKLALVAAVGVLLVWHIRRPNWHVLEGVVFLLSLAIVWLGLSLKWMTLAPGAGARQRDVKVRLFAYLPSGHEVGIRTPAAESHPRPPA
jgi:hypothetical protein